MSQSLIVAPDAAGLPLTPYLTAQEYKDAPAEIDISDLIPAGAAAAEADALVSVITSATSWVDGVCHYTLGATKDIETQRATVRSDGYVRVTTKSKPILEVDSFVMGNTPSTMIGTVNPADGWIEGNTIWMPANYGGTPSRTPYYPSQRFSGRVFCQWTYVNGWANTLLSVATAVADTAVQVVNALGFYPGRQFRIWDAGAGSEVLTVAPTYTPGATTVPIVGTIAHVHALGVSVSALPVAVKKATMLVASGFIRDPRGSEAMEMGAATSTSVGHSGAPVGSDKTGEFELARNLLKPYILAAY